MELMNPLLHRFLPSTMEPSINLLRSHARPSVPVRLRLRVKTISGNQLQSWGGLIFLLKDKCPRAQPNLVLFWTLMPVSHRIHGLHREGLLSINLKMKRFPNLHQVAPPRWIPLLTSLHRLYTWTLRTLIFSRCLWNLRSDLFQMD